MHRTSTGPLFSSESGFGTSNESAYDFLHDVTPFGFETPHPEPTQAKLDETSRNEARFKMLADVVQRVEAKISSIVLLSKRVRAKAKSVAKSAKAGDFRAVRRKVAPGTRQRLPTAPLSPTELAALRARRRQTLIGLAFWTTLTAGLLFMALVALVSFYSAILPDPRLAGLARKPPNITIRSADGEFLAERGMRRGYVTLDQAPRNLINAVIATEDRRFYYHFGFDVVGLSRAAYTNWKARTVIQGGSTLTQQLAKNLFLQPKRNWTRKAEELILSLWLEHKFTKDQIMELYLNRVYFGSGAYGIEAAAYHYFGKNARDLSLSECAMLTGLIKAPSSLSPTHNPDAAQDRAVVVLTNMLDAGLIGEKDYRFALGHPAQLRTKAQTPGFDYLVDWITELVPTLVGEAEGNFTVETTINFALQRDVDLRIQQIMAERGRELEAGEVAVVLLSPDGAVKTLVGGANYDANQFNRAVKGRRQPGSAFKPFLYLAALEAGMTPDTMVDDSPIQVGDWRPQNHDGLYRGMVPLRTALAVSSNTAAVRLFNQLGPRPVIETAQRLGIYSDLNCGPTLALGAAEVSPLELTAAYAPFANGGYPALPYVVERVLDENGKALYQQSHVKPERVISEEHVNAMNEMLNAVVSTGTGRKAAVIGHQTAGKTGTTQNFNDAWFVGYTAQWVGGVWVGNDRRHSMRRVTGGILPAEIWHDIMQRAHKGLKPRPLLTPPVPGSRMVTAQGARATAQEPRSVSQEPRNIPQEPRAAPNLDATNRTEPVSKLGIAVEAGDAPAMVKKSAE